MLSDRLNNKEMIHLYQNLTIEKYSLLVSGLELYNIDFYFMFSTTWECYK